MHGRRIIMAALFATLAGGAYANASVHVESQARADSVTVGQRFLVTHEFTYPDSLRMLPEGTLDLDKTRVLSLDWSESSSKGTTTRRADMWVMSLDLDGATVPPLEFDFVSPSGDTIRAMTDEVDVPVRLVASDSSSLMPLKNQWEAPRSFLVWILAAAGGLALAALAWWWWRRRRAAKEREAPAAPSLPADYVALTELSRIERMGLLESGEFKEYYTLVVDAVRRYLEARFAGLGLEAMDRTSRELMDDLSRRGIETYSLEPLLLQADLVKFAKHVPTTTDGEAAMRSAREVVVKTAPRSAVAGSDEDTEKKAAAGG
jgi:hypothetical protein